MPEYEVWLTDDAGRRTRLFNSPSKDIAFLTYTRAVNGLGTLNFGLAFDLLSDMLPYFRPDWRAEVWRSPAPGVPTRREDVFLLRQPHVYTRGDGVEIIQFYGRNGIDLLKRRSVAQRAGTSWAKKTDQADDFMKQVVREQMLYGSALDEDGVVDNTRAWPQNEFRVQADAGLGPSLTRDFAGRVVFDVLQDLKNSSFQLNESSSSYRRIFFDVVPADVSSLTTELNSPLGWEFRTYADLRGIDRTGGVAFSLENENLRAPSYSLNHLEEVTAVWVRGNGQGLSQIITSVEDSVRVGSSRWNRVEKTVTAGSETTTTALQDAGRAELFKGQPRDKLEVELVNNPGGESVPRSLYGVDWDLGDLVRVEYARKIFPSEIAVVYVSLKDDGSEEISGRTEAVET